MKLLFINLKNKKTRAAAALLLAVILAAAIFAVFCANSPRAPIFDGRGDYLSGIDVSSHNGEIDWETASKNTEFAILRAGYRGYGNGEIKKDTLFENNAEGATKAGLPIGIYFYSQAVNVEEARQEAEFALECAEGYELTLPVFIDFEYAHGKNGEETGRLKEAGLSPSEAADIINAFCSEIKKGGRLAGLYSSSSMLTLGIKTSELDSSVYIWVADYNKAVKYPGRYDAWQYKKHGSCEGVSSKYVDLNYWFTDN